MCRIVTTENRWPNCCSHKCYRSLHIHVQIPDDVACWGEKGCLPTLFLCMQVCKTQACKVIASLLMQTYRLIVIFSNPQDKQEAIFLNVPWANPTKVFACVVHGVVCIDGAQGTCNLVPFGTSVHHLFVYICLECTWKPQEAGVYSWATVNIYTHTYIHTCVCMCVCARICVWETHEVSMWSGGWKSVHMSALPSCSTKCFLKDIQKLPINARVFPVLEVLWQHEFYPVDANTSHMPCAIKRGKHITTNISRP